MQLTSTLGSLECPKNAVSDFDVTSLSNLESAKEVNLLWCHVVALNIITVAVLWVRTQPISLVCSVHAIWLLMHHFGVDKGAFAVTLC